MLPTFISICSAKVGFAFGFLFSSFNLFLLFSCESDGETVVKREKDGKYEWGWGVGGGHDVVF